MEEVKKDGRGGARRKPTGNVWTKTTMTFKPSQWEKMQKAASLSGEKVSRFSIKIAMEYKGTPPTSRVGEDELTQRYPLCFTKVELENLQTIADSVEMKKSKYFINCVMDYIEKNNLA